MMPDRIHQRRRTVRLLAIAAAIASLIAILLNTSFRPAAQTHDRMGQLVLPGFKTLRQDASRLKITLADESYTLINSSEGWTLEGQGGYPVRPDRLADLANGLSELSWGEARTRDAEKLNRVGLGDPREGGSGALIEVYNRAGKITASIITGRKGEHLYARLPKDKQAYQVNGNLPPLYNASAWLDLDILDIHDDAVSAVRLFDRSGRSLYLQRAVGSSDRAFRPAPPYQNYRLVSRLAVSGPALALTRFDPISVKPASSLGTEPVARHITETHDGLEIELNAYLEPDGYFVTLKAIEAGEGAQRGATINERASGWAFELSELDWSEFTPDINQIVIPPGTEPTASLP